MESVGRAGVVSGSSTVWTSVQRGNERYALPLSLSMEPLAAGTHHRMLPFRPLLSGPQAILHGRRVDLSTPAARAILAGRAPPPDAPIPHDEAFAIAETRSRWLNFNAFFALVWARDVWNGAFFALTTMRMQLEPFSLGSPPKLEEVSEPPELCLEVAALWLRVAGACMYACKEIMGPRGNPNWDPRRGCPGASGGTWDGVDGYDLARWAHWKGILKAAAEAEWGESVIEAVNVSCAVLTESFEAFDPRSQSAIEAMETVERDAATQ